MKTTWHMVAAREVQLPSSPRAGEGRGGGCILRNKRVGPRGDMYPTRRALARARRGGDPSPGKEGRGGESEWGAEGATPMTQDMSKVMGSLVAGSRGRPRKKTFVLATVVTGPSR